MAAQYRNAYGNYAAAKSMMGKLSRADLTKKNAFIAAPMDRTHIYEAVTAVTGIPWRDTPKWNGGGTNIYYVNFYFGTQWDIGYPESANLAYWGCMVYAMEIAQTWWTNNYNAWTSQGQAQGYINQVRGAKQVELNAMLVSIMAGINAYQKIQPSNSALSMIAQRYNGTSFAYVERTFAKALTINTALKVWSDGLVKLKQFIDQCANVVKQQAAELEALRREAEGLVTSANSLNAQVTGAPNGTYATEIIMLVQQQYVPQIAGLKILIPRIKQTILNQYTQRLIADVEVFMLESMENLNHAKTLINMLPASQLKTDLLSQHVTYVTRYNNLSKESIEDAKKALASFVDFNKSVSMQVNRYFYNQLLIEVNKILNEVPESFALALWTELKDIQGSVDPNVTDSYKAGFDRLTILLPQIDVELAKAIAFEEEERIRINEEARIEELALLEMESEEKKTAGILELQQLAVGFLAQMPDELINLFQAKMDIADTQDSVAQLAFYAAIIPIMETAIGLLTKVESGEITAETITGIIYEKVDNLAFAVDFFEQNILSEDAPTTTEIDQITLTPAPGGNLLPLLLSAGILYLTTV